MYNTAADRYAQSIMELAAERGELESVHADMLAFSQVLAAEPELRRALVSPIISSDKKLAILQAVFGSKFSTMVMNFIELISRRKREDMLVAIADAFLRKYNLTKGYTTGRLTSASPLDAAQMEQIASLAEGLAGMKVNITTTLDPALIGGFILRVGDKQIDQSVASRLERLHRQLKNPSVAVAANA